MFKYNLYNFLLYTFISIQNNMYTSNKLQKKHLKFIIELKYTKYTLTH